MKVFTGSPPFGGMGVPAVIKCIMDGERPRRPNCSDITESLWTLIQRCWDKESRNRPEMREVITELVKMSVFLLHLDDKSLTHCRVSTSQTTETFQRPLGETPSTTADPPTTVDPSTAITPVVPPHPRTHQDQQETPREPRVLGESTSPSQPPIFTSGTGQEVSRVPQKKHGLWCRIRRRVTRAVGGTTSRRSSRRPPGVGSTFSHFHTSLI